MVGGFTPPIQSVSVGRVHENDAPTLFVRAHRTRRHTARPWLAPGADRRRFDNRDRQRSVWRHVPGAIVTATNDATGVTYTAVSNEAGNYTVTSLPVGRT
jgi:hypothetical protein